MAGTLVTDTLKSSTTSPPAFQNTNGTQIGTLCRAWANWNGSGTIYGGTGVGSFNVSSITVNSTGNYTVNFTNTFSDTNYTPVFGGGRGASDGNFVLCVYPGGTYTTSQLQLAAVLANNPGVYTSFTYNCIAVFR